MRPRAPRHAKNEHPTLSKPNIPRARINVAHTIGFVNINRGCALLSTVPRCASRSADASRLSQSFLPRQTPTLQLGPSLFQIKVERNERETLGFDFLGIVHDLITMR